MPKSKKPVHRRTDPSEGFLPLGFLCGCPLKTYIANGWEYYEYGTDAPTRGERVELKACGQSTVIKKDFPFPGSLLSLLRFDTRKLEPLIKQLDKSIRNFLPFKNERYAAEVLSALNKLVSTLTASMASSASIFKKAQSGELVCGCAKAAANIWPSSHLRRDGFAFLSINCLKTLLLTSQ